MSKYAPLWEYIKKQTEDSFSLSFEEIQNVLGFAIDHSFLNSKEELIDYGYKVEKISLKQKCVSFKQIQK